MKTIIASNLPEKCWIYSKKRYICKGLDLSPELPYVDSEYESILVWQNIPYRTSLKALVDSSVKLTEVLEYWDPEVYEEEDLTLPLFVEFPSGYKDCERNYTAKVPTSKTISAAKKLSKIVLNEIAEYDKTSLDVEYYLFAKENLKGRDAVVCESYDLPCEEIYEININNDNFKFLRLFSMSRCHLVAIFDMNKIVPNITVTLRVPDYLSSCIIGKDGSNIKSLAEKIGVKKIHVVPI